MDHHCPWYINIYYIIDYLLVSVLLDTLCNFFFVKNVRLLNNELSILLHYCSFLLHYCIIRGIIYVFWNVVGLYIKTMKITEKAAFILKY